MSLVHHRSEVRAECGTAASAVEIRQRMVPATIIFKARKPLPRGKEA